jgi:antitoxin component of MazEF toxin-antitoxin module
VVSQATTNICCATPGSLSATEGQRSQRWERSRCSSELVYSLYSRWVAVQTRVQKWGNSSLSANDGELVVKPVVPVRLSLNDLLAEVSEENLLPLIDTGSAVGVCFVQ